jgi:hypothetical protein
MALDWNNPIKHEHPNVFLRIYGDMMMKIADFFTKRGINYSTTYELIELEDDEVDEVIDLEDLQFEFSMWSPKRHV